MHKICIKYNYIYMKLTICKKLGKNGQNSRNGGLWEAELEVIMG